MNKNKRIILTIITILVSTMLFVNKTYAAKELTCIYDNSLGQDNYKMLVQLGDGSQKVYIGPSKSFDSKDWVEQAGFSITNKGGTPEHGGGRVSNDNKYKYEVRSLNTRSLSTEIESCPKYIGINPNNTTVTLSNVKNDSADYELLNSYDKIPDTRQFYKKFNNKVNFDETISNTEWYAKCVYDSNGETSETLYFNNDTFIISDEGASSAVMHLKTNFNLDELLEIYNSSSNCPARLYVLTPADAPQNNTLTISLKHPHTHDTIIGEFGQSYTEDLLNSEKSKIFRTVETPTPIPAPTNCEELFGEELIEKINSVMNIIKIAVPILLIAFGIFDFTKAMFASNEDDMKKAQKTFLKRIVAAFIVFLSPMIINLILSLTNKVWSSISTNTCIK